jgi:hypothetical protein
MSPRARMTLFVIAAALLVATGVLFALGGGEEPPEPVSRQSPVAGEWRSVAEAASEHVLEEQRAEAEATRARELRRHDPQGDPGHAEPRPRDERRLELIGDEAEAVAGEFYGAFAAYELGSLDAEIRATVRATATRAFARTLLAAPPRVPLGAEQPGRGGLGSLQFVTVDSHPARREVAAAELVGEVERDGERSPIAIELVNHGGWRVAGISR